MSPNCTNTEVRDIIDTGLTDARLTALIVLADAEITQRKIDASSDILKTISMLITASLAAMQDARSVGKADYGADYPRGADTLTKMYRKAADALIDSCGDEGEIAFVAYSEPEEE